MKIMRGFFTILVMIFLMVLMISGSVSATNYYIDKDAKGRNDGSSFVNAWQSFSSIDWAKIKPGDTLYISGGPQGLAKTYYETLNVKKSGTSGNSITFTIDISNSNHNGMVVIDGQDKLSVGIQLSDWVTIDGKDNGYTYPHKGVDDYNIKIKNVDECVKGDGTSVGNTVNYIECTATNGYGIKLWGGHYNKANYNYVHHVGATGISFTNTGNSYPSYKGWKVGDNEAGYNYIEWVGLKSTTDGITFKDGAWAHHNRIDHSGVVGAERAHRDCIVIQGSHGLVENNICSDFGQQLYVNCLGSDWNGDNHWRDITLRNNLVYTSDDSLPWGIAFAIAGQLGGVCDEVKVYHNTFIGMKGNYILIDGAIGNEIEIKNNIFYVPASNNALIRGTREADPVFDYNIHYGPKIKWYGTTYTFSEFQNSGQEKHGYNIDPKLIDPSVGDDVFDANLKPDSPACGTGEGGTDIGAYPCDGGAKGNVYHVKKDGSGDFTTIQACADIAKTGDTCVVHAGTYYESISPKNSGTEGNYITYRAYTGDKAIIRPGDGKPGFDMDDKDYIKIDGFEIIGGSYGIYSNNGRYGPISQDVLVTNNVIHGQSKKGIFGRFYRYTISHNKVYDTGEHNIQVWDNMVTNREVQTVIEYNEVWNAGEEDGIHWGGKHVTVKGNLIHDIDGAGHADGMQIDCGEFSLVENNIVYNTRSQGMMIDCIWPRGDQPGPRSNEGLIIRGNIFYATPDFRSYSNQGIRLNIYDAGQGCQIKNNIIANTHSSRAMALRIRDCKATPCKASSCEVKNNIFYNNDIPNGYEDVSKHSIDYNLYSKQGSPKDNEDYGVHSFEADPLFVDPANYDFHLQPNSPACGAGEGGTDIGAYPCDGVTPKTCQNQGYYCCDSCQSGPHPEYDSDCSGQVCCEVCKTAGPYFPPEQYIEAEKGEITYPMQSAYSSSASGGYYIYTGTSNQGSVSFTFDIQNPGGYIMEARILTPSPNPGGHNSFFVGLDGEPANGDNKYTFDTIQTDVFTWDNVSLRGAKGNFTYSEFDPMVWNLSKGLHTFTFYGRESDTWLDQIILRRLYHRADINQDGCIEMMELISFINRWKISFKDVSMPEMMEAVSLWKKGC